MSKILYLIQSQYNVLTATIKFDDLFNYANKNDYDKVAIVETNSLYGYMDAMSIAQKLGIEVIYSLHVKLEKIVPEMILVPKNDIGMSEIIKLSTLILNNEFSDTKQIDFKNIFVFSNEKIKYVKTVILKDGFKNIPIINSFTNSELSIMENFNNNLSDYYYSLESFKDNKNKIGYDENFLQALNKVKLNPVINKYSLPNYQAPKGYNSGQYLKELSSFGLQKRLDNNVSKEYVERLKYELDVIDKMEFNDYFLIVYDIIKMAKQKGVLVGPARGSSAGSLVAYTLGITDIDPLKYNLMFERFLNTHRHEMPDIDIDFPDDRRSLVIDDIVEKYGKDRVYGITTFATFGHKRALNDYLKPFKLDERRVNGIINSITNNKLDETDELANKTNEAGKLITGQISNTSTHPAGIIITKESLYGKVAYRPSSLGIYQIQYDLKIAEKLGLVKIDLLSLSTLTTIQKILDHLKIKLAWNKIDLKDERTYQLLSSGNTDNIFQLESVGMRRVLQRLKPKNFNELIALLALYRPGPMDQIDVYIKNKNSDKVTYIDNRLEEILEETYGIIVYQEQILAILNKVAGFSLSESDLIRRAISKKDRELLKTYRNEFIKGASLNGYNRDISNKIFEHIYEFADYGFNKSHSVSYAHITYLLAYLKANYYKEFTAVILSNEISNKQSLLRITNEAKSNNLKILKPHINYSTFNFLPGRTGILTPLSACLSLSKEMVNQIIFKREEKLFTSFEDFKERTKDFLNDGALTSLIYSGALDSIGKNRQTMIKLLDVEITSMANILDDIIIPEYEEFNKNYLINKQKEYLSFTTSD